LRPAHVARLEGDPAAGAGPAVRGRGEGSVRLGRLRRGHGPDPGRPRLAGEEAAHRRPERSAARRRARGRRRVIPFLLLAAVAVGSGLLVVGSRDPVVSALWLALAFVAVAGLFVVLGAEFLAAIQLIVYAGAILVFFLFVIMLLGVGNLGPPA